MTDNERVTTNSDEERIAQIRERLAAHRQEVDKYRGLQWAEGTALRYYEAPDDVELLLSLLDRQAAGDSDNAAIGNADKVLLDALRRVRADEDDYWTFYQADPLMVKAADRIEELLAWLGTEQSMHAAWRKRAEESENAATRMREACVGKVKAIDPAFIGNWMGSRYVEIDRVIEALSSLTLDQVEQEKSKKGKQEQWATIICPTCNHDVTTNAPEALLKKINSALARERKEARAAAFKEMFKVLCPDCAEGDCPVFDRQARWYYHGEMHGTVGCSASKLRIEAAANTAEGAGSVDNN